MKIIKMALAAAFAVASTTATASVVETQKGEAANASYCELAVIIIAPDGVYGVYECTYVGGGWY